MREMLRRGWLGEKSGQGFYKRVKGPDGESVILELNLDTLEYQPQQKVRYPSLGEARKISDPRERILTILAADDRAGQLARQTTADSLIYAADRATEIADSIVAIDEAMRWGFNFEVGSFEVWDALLQHPETMQKVLQDRPLPELVLRVQSEGRGTFYTGTAGQRQYFDFHTGTYQDVPTPEGAISLEVLRAGNKVLRDNGSASLIELGDGVACIEFHTKMNSIDEGIIEMLRSAVEEGQKQFRALVIGNEGADFSAGANLLLHLVGASLESQLAKKTGGPFTPSRRAFEIIASATVSTSAVEAQELRFLRKSDPITINRDLLLRDAKADAIRLAEAHEAGKWQPAQPTMMILPGPGARLVLEQQIESLLFTGKISEHDAVVGRHLARVVTGGDCSPITPITEQQVLDLEREAFLSLCGMEKTQERMQAILMTGKPLRN